MDPFTVYAVAGIIVLLVVVFTTCYAVDAYQKRQISVMREMHELERIRNIVRRGKE